MTHNVVVIRYGFSLHKKAFHSFDELLIRLVIVKSMNILTIRDVINFNFNRIVPRIITEIGHALRVWKVVSIRAKSLIPIALTNPPYSIPIGIPFYVSAKLALLI